MLKDTLEGRIRERVTGCMLQCVIRNELTGGVTRLVHGRTSIES